jgi:DNA-binding transcriptional LysR family regulator
MNVFLTVARRGSFSAASAALGISRAMASKQIKALEDYLGVRLFDRNTRAVNLTETGRTYMERCQTLLEDLEELESAVRSNDSVPQGTLKIAAPSFFGSQHLVLAIAAYMEANPNVAVELWLKERMIDLVEEGLDMAIVVNELVDSSLVARRISSLQMIVCAGPGYLRHHGVPEAPRELVRHNCLILSNDAGGEDWSFAGPDGEISMRVSGDFRSNTSGALRMAAIQDVGVIYLPDYVVEEDIALGRLVPVLSEFCSEPRPIYALYPHRRHLSGKVRVFVEFLQEWFDRDGSYGRSEPEIGASADLVKF